ncbi:hypothetical protein [Chryseobacterium indologenes]|uniref:hypothetical protein n=1 Tax=Chryseobacterium indologenes TaxID=253 RepID=UPI001BCD51D1|nr:hypothetical protein [Chryseobacterium indologenes]
MKTLKLIIAGIAIATLAYSCSNDRDDETRQKAIEDVKNSNREFKLNQKGLTAKDGAEAKTDTISVKGQNSTSSGPYKPDPTDGTGTDPDPVVDPTKPDKPW